MYILWQGTLITHTILQESYYYSHITKEETKFSYNHESMILVQGFSVMSSVALGKSQPLLASVTTPIIQRPCLPCWPSTVVWGWQLDKTGSLRELRGASEIKNWGLSFVSFFHNLKGGVHRISMNRGKVVQISVPGATLKSAS